MRIVLVLAASPNPTFTSSLWKSNLHDPLVAMGHDVVLFEDGVLPLFDLDPDAPSTVEPRARFGERLSAAVEAAHRAARLDLILTYVGDSHLEPAVIERLRATVAPVVNFSCNNIHQFHLVRRTAHCFDLCLVPEHEALARYRAAGATPIYWPMAAHPEAYPPLDLVPDLGATFAGQRYGDRTTLMLALLEAGLDAHAFGQGWEPERAIARGAAEAQGPLAAALKLTRDTLRGRRPWVALADREAWRRLRAHHAGALHGPVDDAAYVRLFSRSRVNLGFLVLGDTHRTLRPLRQVRLREFEATMAGGFYLTGWLPELEQLYELGREIETYRSPAELVDKCRFYLKDDAARERIRRAGHARARRDHTWTRRFETLFEELKRRGLSPRAGA
jgi:spore maturation protein CgeB